MKLLSRRFIGIMLTVMLVLSSLTTVLATDVEFTGSGTEGDPYLITSEEDLQNLSELINEANEEYVSAYYRLTDDLDFTSYGKLYQPIGTAANPFKGSFDGNGHVVSNISNEDQSETMREYGVFGALGENAVVRNLGVNKVTFKNNKAWTQNYMGGIAGKIVGDASIENCYTTGCVFNLYGNAQDCGSGGIAGGVLAEATLTVKNCYSTAIKGDYTKKSGIVYCTESSGTSAGRAVLTNCYSVNGDTSPDTTNVSKTNCYLASDADCTAEHLGSSFETDIFGLNNGLPILSWQKNYKVNTLAAVQNGTLSASGAEGDAVSYTHLLETILMMKNKKGYVRSIDIAHELSFTKPSVSVAMKSFREEGYITVDETGGISLTEKGLAIAQRVYERHQVIARALMVLGVDEKTAYEDSCKIEHDISNQSFEKIKEHLVKNHCLLE